MPQPAAVAAPAFCLSLHIRHPSLDPQEISRQLRLTAADAFGAGEPRRSRHSVGGGVHGETYWAAQLDPMYWRRRLPVEAAPSAESAVPLPEDREERFKLLVERGHAQGYLTHAELRAHLPGESGAGGPDLHEVVRTLGEQGIPVHEQASPALEAIQRGRVFDLDPLKNYLERHPAMHLVEVLSLVCLRLATRHAAFLQKIRAAGGSVRLLVTLSARAVQGLTMTPELTARLAQLGITLELALAPGASERRSKAGAV